jgi:tetratricopeptide (TPR) repeat protein
MLVCAREHSASLSEIFMRNIFYPALVAALFLSGCAQDQAISAASNSAAGPGVSGRVDPLELELSKLEEADEAAQKEVDAWIQENNEFATRNAGLPAANMRERIRKRFAPVRKGYEDFIRRHPDYAPARLAYATFLGALGEEEAEFQQLEKARDLDPGNADVWNNLANHFGHTGSLDKAFEYYEKAISLNPSNSIYYHNFGTTVYLFRADVKRHYQIEEQQVFDKALNLYRQAMTLDPTNFPLASDVAQSYYAIKPLRTNDALQAWTNALAVAHDDLERQGVHIHFARIKMAAGLYSESWSHLNAVTNSAYDNLKQRLIRNLAEREGGTNRPAAP